LSTVTVAGARSTVYRPTAR